ncbi:MAG: phosphopantetheine-binding protein [Chloroflexi bacterium]|nr:phosphopantetheine-binding protein [Chloroflexota bacterium]
MKKRPIPEPISLPATRDAPPATRDSIAPQIITLIAEQTGYPEDMLDLDLDLEADLGIDTVKQAETFAAIRKEFDIPLREDLNLRSYNYHRKGDWLCGRDAAGFEE